MILHLSRKLADRLKCKLTLKDEKIVQSRRMDSWSADFLSLPNIGKVALVMHDASLWPIIVPMQPRMSYEAFLSVLLLHISASYAAFDAHFDFSNQTVLVTKRSNRRVIGSMNEALLMIRFEAEAMHRDQGAVDWPALVANIAHTPFSAVEGHFPDRQFAKLLGG